jgi:WD40 repeat protein
VLRSHKALERKRNKTHREGLLYFGALREILLIAFSLGFVMTSLWQASSLLNIHLSPQKSESANSDIDPVMNLALNQEHLTLFTRSITGKLSQISLKTGVMSPRPVPMNVAGVAMSSDASTIVVLEEWPEDRQIHHRIDIIKDDRIVLSEELKLEPFADASVYISPNGNVVMSFSSRGHGIGWDLTDSEPRRWEISVGPISHMNCLSPDGLRLLISSKDGPPYLCDAQTGEGRLFLDRVERGCQSVAWSADGNQLSIGDQGGDVHVFDTVTGQRTWHQKLNMQFARSVAFSHDGENLAVGGFDEVIRVWDLSRPDQQPIQLKGQSGVIRSLIFTDSNKNLISGSFNGTIFEWSLANQNCIRRFQ